MRMTSSERARALRIEADEVLDRIQLREHCSGIGKITPTGSYFLDVMMYPDIDLYLPPTSPGTLMGVGTRLAALDCVKRVVFEKGGPAELAAGLYLKPVVEHGSWGRPWKIDIWSLPMSIIEKKQEELLRIRERMTSEQREGILECKFKLLTDAGRTPMFSGIHIYRAVIDEGLEDFESIVRYLRVNGISV